MTDPRCADHTTSPVFPKGCHICQRITLEQDIVTRTVEALLAAGYALNIDNGGDELELKRFTTDRAEVLGAMMETDEECLVAQAFARDEQGRPVTAGQWVRFVYGNDGYDVVNDYTTGLEAVMAPINAYSDSMS